MVYCGPFVYVSWFIAKDNFSIYKVYIQTQAIFKHTINLSRSNLKYGTARTKSRNNSRPLSEMIFAEELERKINSLKTTKEHYDKLVLELVKEGYVRNPKPLDFQFEGKEMQEWVWKKRYRF